jgi:hypothetical protein
MSLATDNAFEKLQLSANRSLYTLVNLSGRAESLSTEKAIFSRDMNSEGFSKVDEDYIPEHDDRGD